MNRPETTSTLARTDFSLFELAHSDSREWTVCPTIDPTSLVGPGRDAIYIYDVSEELFPIPTQPPASHLLNRQKFDGLVQVWRSAVRFLSDTDEICSHPAYQEIMKMGKAALPFIFEELEREPDSWFWALKTITGADPVPEEHCGDVHAMTRDWLHWAQKNGYSIEEGRLSKIRSAEMSA